MNIKIISSPVWDYVAEDKSYISNIKLGRNEWELTKRRYCTRLGAEAAAKRQLRQLYESARNSKTFEEFVHSNGQVPDRDKRK
jgi:hypothetical protein